LTFSNTSAAFWDASLPVKNPSAIASPKYYIAQLKQQAVAAPCKKKRADIMSGMMVREERN
jgi:hypothetical protein